MPRHTEALDGGLWTSEDPAFLEPGQLSAIQNAIYSANSRFLTRATGRSSFGVVSAGGDVDGIRDLQFDNGDHYLVAMVSTAYATAAVGDTGTFASASAITGGTQLERVHYRNRYFLLNGVTASADAINTNQAVYLSATAANTPPTFRQHGMLPVISAPSASASAGGSTTFSQTVTGYYEYWTTEVAAITQDGAELKLESAYSADTNPTTIFVSSTGMAPVISMPAVRNTITTHWRVYRSPKKDAEADRKFPSGFMIAEQSTASASVLDSLTVASASSFPSSFNSSAPWNNWTAAVSATADDGNYASATGITVLTPSQQLFYGFNLGGFSGSVKGIQVEVQAYATAASMVPVPITVTVGVRNSSGTFLDSALSFGHSRPSTLKVASKSGNVTSSNSASPTTLTLGAATDRWFASNMPGLVDTDFGSNFAVRVAASKTGAVLGVDYVKATVHYAATVDGTVPFPTVVYTFGDIIAQVAKNHPPPNASTGDLYEDCLVVNDRLNPALIRWSFPGEPESFPPTYFLDFETTENDRVTNIKVVNNVLVVGLETSLWRINALPNERAASFDRGRAIEVISRTYGVVNEMCACVFTIPGHGDRLAFVSNQGIHSTDGFNFDTYTDGLDWRGMISTSSTSAPIALINDPDRQELLFFYRNDALGNETYQRLTLSYSDGHLQGGRPKVSGPVHMRNYHAGTDVYASLESAWPVARASGETSIYLGYGSSSAAGGGSVYRETGTTIPAKDDRMAWVTRRMYLADLGGEWEMGDLYGYATYSGSPELTITVENTKTDDTGPTTFGSKSKTLAGQRLFQVNSQFGALEGIRVSAVATATTYSQGMWMIEGENFGTQDAGT